MAKKKLIPEYNFSLGKDAQTSSSTIRNIYDKISNSEKSFYQRISELKNNQSNNNISMTDIIRNFIRKNVDDSVSGEISFNKGIKSGNYTPGLGGVGFRMYNDDNGKGILDIDNINVREAIYTTVLTYNKVNSVGGSIVISAAWCTVLRSQISGSGQFRICTVWFKPEGYSANPWVIGDQVRMQRGLDKMLYTHVKDLSIEPNENGEYWIDLYMGYNPTAKIGDSTPVEGDVLVQWGNKDPLASQNRKNIIIISSGDGGSEYPYIEQYVGVDSFDLSNKLMARISSDVYFGSPDKSKYLWWNKENNSEFLIKGVLTQSPSDDTSPLPVWRGEWDNETEYFAGDLVSFGGTTYICIEQTNAGDDPTDQYYWSVYASAGSNGKMLSISGSSQIFKIDKFSVGSPDYISISAVGSNLSGTPSFSVSSGTATLTNETTYSKRLLLSNMSSENVTIKVDWDGFTDYYTVYKVREGSDAITVVLSNQQGHISCDSNWTVLDLSGTSTLISVYYGAEQLAFDDNSLGGGFPSSNGKWRFTYAEAPSISFDSYYVVDSYTVLIEPSQELTQLVNSTWRDYTIRARVNNTNHEITVRQNIAVIRNGAKGDTGSVGQSVRYSNWINGNTYFAGNINDGGIGNNPNRYIDYVTFENGGIVRAYKCKVYHIASDGINSPDVSATYWEQVSYFPVIASNLLLANEAVIGGFVFSQAIDSSGNAIPVEEQEIRTSDDPINPAIRLKGDGSGNLAKGNISWNSNGTRIDINGNIVSKSGEIGGLKIYNNSLESKNMSFTEGDIEQILELKTPTSEYFPYSSTCYADGVFSPGNLIHAYTDNIYIPFNGYIELRVIRTKASPNLPAYDTAYTLGSRIDLTDVYGNVVVSTQLTSLSEPNYITIPISTGTYIIHAYSGANKVIPVGGGTYKIGEPVYSSVEIKGNSTDGIYAYGISRCTKIGNNGIYSFFGSENYLHFSEDYGMEIQANTAIYSPNGQYGIRITNTGIEKTSNYGASWSPI